MRNSTVCRTPALPPRGRLPRRAALPCIAAGLALAAAAPAHAGTCLPAIPCADPRGCPDLVVDQGALARDAAVDSARFRDIECTVIEGEVGAGQRLLLRFTTTTPNLGPGDLFVGNPREHPEWFDLETCHGHEHLKEYSDYRLWTPLGYEQWRALRAANTGACARDLLRANPALVDELVVGRKQGFCLADVALSEVPCHAPPDPDKYSVDCTFQGISVCWADVYDTFLDGQWIDITYVPSGSYVLEVEVNAERFFEELDYSNDSSAVPVTIANPNLEVCDGVDNDGNGGIDDTDLDADGFSACSTDCNDHNPLVNPAAAEACNGIDDDCDGMIDDGIPDLDADLDQVRDACDNCPLSPNPGQAESDGDLEGDACDLDDGLLLFTDVQAESIGWQRESVYTSFNLYRGDLEVLRSTGEYTQDPSTTPAAARFCGLLESSLADPFLPPPGGVVFYLATGVAGTESSLGTKSNNDERLNTRPCMTTITGSSAPSGRPAT